MHFKLRFYFRRSEHAAWKSPSCKRNIIFPNIQFLHSILVFRGGTSFSRKGTAWDVFGYPPLAISGIWNLMKSKRGTFPYLGITRGIPNHLAVKQALHFQFAPKFHFLHLRYGIQKKDGVVIHLHFLLQYPFPKKKTNTGVTPGHHSQSSPGNCWKPIAPQVLRGEICTAVSRTSQDSSVWCSVFWGRPSGFLRYGKGGKELEKRRWALFDTWSWTFEKGLIVL